MDFFSDRKFQVQKFRKKLKTKFGPKKKKKNFQKKIFFALKSFLNDFKAILRKKNFFRIFHMGEICLGENEKFGKKV